MTQEEKNQAAVLRVRRAYLRVFDPQMGEQADDDDRRIVLSELASFCHYDEEFPIDKDSTLAAYQLAGFEGRRSVFIRIRKVLAQAHSEMLAQQEKEVAKAAIKD